MSTSEFCAFILTHGRPDRVYTFDSLRGGGYSGPIFLLVDDEDKSVDEYRERFGDQLVTFCKQEWAEKSDEGDNSNDRRTPLYARNASFEVAQRLGFRYFVQLDDDYKSGFYIRYNKNYEYGNTLRIKQSLDKLFSIFIDFLKSTPTQSVAMSQGGDHIGGGGGPPRLTRKAMNTFFCDVQRPFKFRGRLNDDVSTYVALGNVGRLFFTAMQAQVNQLATQTNAGGLTEMYLEHGTYVKSFFTVMYAPSCTQVGVLGDPRNGSEGNYRIHHKIKWENAVPKILREKVRKV